MKLEKYVQNSDPELHGQSEGAEYTKALFGQRGTWTLSKTHWIPQLQPAL
jgi:hypothetical protein